MNEPEWQLMGEDDWVFGVKVRGAVRCYTGCIYFDEDIDSNEGGWVWIALVGPPSIRGLAVNRWTAMENVERALGIT
jgi:hypothetical protein